MSLLSVFIDQVNFQYAAATGLPPHVDLSRYFSWLMDRLRAAELERDKLHAFKAWVHEYLDGQGVPHHPPGTHGAEGCRVGDRMDWLMERQREVFAKYQRLLVAVRKHRDQRGDDRCHLDDGELYGELYAALPEGDTRPARDTAVTLENCQRFIACRQQGREYVSPQRRIEELEAAISGALALWFNTFVADSYKKKQIYNLLRQVLEGKKP